MSFWDESGYGLSDPKHPTYVERYAGFADHLRKAARENPPHEEADALEDQGGEA